MANDIYGGFPASWYKHYYPTKWFRRSHTGKVGLVVEMYGDYDVTFRCLCCGTRFTRRRLDYGEPDRVRCGLAAGWWKCPKGCNADRTKDLRKVYAGLY